MDLRPLPRATFPPGSGPFGVRGMVVTGVVAYAENAIAGGSVAVRAKLPRDTAAYLDRPMFLAATLYDLSPVAEFCCAAAQIQGRSAAAFIRERSHFSAGESLNGVYRTQLGAKTPREMAVRLPRIFKRFFDPCEAEGTLADDDHMRVVFIDLPLPLAPFYAWSTEGFVGGALEAAGAKAVEHTWQAPEPVGDRQGVPLVNLTLETRWAT